MTTYGTSYFVDLESAVRYYRDYHESRTAVLHKVADGSIHLGKPPLKAGETLSLIDDGRRYAITEAADTLLLRPEWEV